MVGWIMGWFLIQWDWDKAKNCLSNEFQVMVILLVLGLGFENHSFGVFLNKEHVLWEKNTKNRNSTKQGGGHNNVMKFVGRMAETPLQTRFFSNVTLQLVSNLQMYWLLCKTLTQNLIPFTNLLQQSIMFIFWTIKSDLAEMQSFYCVWNTTRLTGFLYPTFFLSI